MSLRNSSLGVGGALAVFSAALLVAGCGGGGKGDATPGNPSNNTSVCAYTKRVGSGSRIYVEMAVTPVSLEPTACRAFNGGFGGWRLPPVGRMGTGHVYCGYRKSGSSYTITLGVFASGRRTGLAFCRSFHPGSGFRRDVSVSGYHYRETREAVALPSAVFRNDRERADLNPASAGMPTPTRPKSSRCTASSAARASVQRLAGR